MQLTTYNTVHPSFNTEGLWFSKPTPVLSLQSHFGSPSSHWDKVYISFPVAQVKTNIQNRCMTHSVFLSNVYLLPQQDTWMYTTGGRQSASALCGRVRGSLFLHVCNCLFKRENQSKMKKTVSSGPFPAQSN